MTSPEKERCPCCKYATLPERNSYEICPVCFWEDDGQNEDRAEEVWGGPNYALSLRDGQRNFAEFGATERRFLKHVRPPLPDEL